MVHFSIPSNFQQSYVEELAKKNKSWQYPVEEVYGCLNPSIFGSGRSDSYLQRVDFNSLEKYVGSCKRNDIEFNYVLNFNCSSNLEFRPDGKRKIIRYIQKLSSLGVERFTVVLPSIIDLMNQYVPNAKVSVSVISDVDSPAKLNAFLIDENVDRIIIPEFMNRKIAQLEKLVKYGKDKVKFGTIVNSTCLIDCPFRNFHYAFNSHKSGGKPYNPVDYWSTRCTLVKLNNPVEALKIGWIRPEDLKRYIEMGIDLFKIGGRENKKADFIKAVGIYNQGTFDGNLWELLRCFADASAPTSELVYSRMFDMPNKGLEPFAARFFEAKSFCSTKNCTTCNYCQSNAHLVHVPKANEWKSQLQKEHSSFLEASSKKTLLDRLKID